MQQKRYRIGFDIGGTFTDFVLADEKTNAVTLHKCLTTSDDPSIGALTGLGEITAMAGIGLADIAVLVHGTTLVTNAIIERRGAKLGLITTAGFRDILEMGTEQRYDIYDLFLKFPEPLVPRRWRLGVPERMAADGEVITPLNAASVRAAAQRLAAEGCEALAIAFLHSYINPAHELEAARIAREACPDISVSISSGVVSEMREYQRIVTTCANAYVQPLMGRYIKRLERELRGRGFTGALYLMHSAGGLMSPEMAQELPIRLLESGPAGGTLATALFGARAGLKDAIAFDMGGTTAKASLILNGKCEIEAVMEAARVERFKKGSGIPIKAPVVDMIEIGAGGGSIARIDEVGLLRIGPDSAGADPGPACYGKGGTLPTVTDANVALGYYDPGFFLGGRMKLDAKAANAALGSIGKRLKLPPVRTAWGIYRVVTENMAAAARVHLVERGRDPRRYAMVGFGGAGPAHAAEVARILGVRDLIIPPASGAASALGFLAAPLTFESVRTQPARLDASFNPRAVNATLAGLESETRARLLAAGVKPRDIRVIRSADMRLAGQIHEINVPLPPGIITSKSLNKIQANFAKVYTARYTSLFTGAQVEALNFRVRSEAPAPEINLTAENSSGAKPAKKGMRRAFFETAFVNTPVYDRYALRPGARIVGPAIIEEREATTILPPGDTLGVDKSLNLRIKVSVPALPKALVTAQMPLRTAIARIEADPVTLEIMWSRLVTITEEMWLTICRTAFSLIISESQDFATELLDPLGETLAHSPKAMPVFNLTLPRAVKALLAKFPAETLRPGDVLITNDPWLCAGHLFDIAIVTPVFRKGNVVALMGTVGHVSDIGGTKDSLHARELFEEGVQIPPMKLFKAGRPCDDVFTLLAENVRNPNQVLGDIHSFIAANQLGAGRLLAFMDEYGVHDLTALAAVVQGRSEKAMRQAIRALPDGEYSSEIWNNPMGTPMRFPVRIIKKRDRILLDFEGAPPQVAQGGLNCTLNYTAAHATYPMKCMLTPGVRGNAGCYRPFEVKAPAGSILNCSKPAAVNLRTRTGWYLAPNIFRAMSTAAPAQVQAMTGLPVTLQFYGHDGGGRLYSDHLFVGAGQGGGSAKDGISGLLYPTSASNTSIELVESRAPVIVLEKSYIADSGGPGRHRGGLGQVVRVRKRRNDGIPMMVSAYPEGVGVQTPGLLGGKAGRAARATVRNPQGEITQDLGTGALVTITRADQIVELTLSGGAGFGDPRARSALEIQRDLDEGFVTPECAKSDYGADSAAPGRSDPAARAAQRNKRQAAG